MRNANSVALANGIIAPNTIRAPLPAGDYAVYAQDGMLLAAVERRSLENLAATLSDGTLAFQMLRGGHGLTVAVGERLPRNTAASVRGGKLALEALEGIEIPAALEQARDGFARMPPLVPLPQLLLEVVRWVPFSKELLHLTARGEPSPRHVASARPALFAVLVAEASRRKCRKWITSKGDAAGLESATPTFRVKTSKRP